MEKTYHTNIKQKKAGVALLKSNKEFGGKKITRDRGRHYIMIKWSITKNT